ncbi:10196_t:CDS:2 [Funneliformis geosporum]|nr:10196_t:CDS:2 [Funneliformis geosporum]
MSNIFEMIDSLGLPQKDSNKLQAYLITRSEERTVLYSALTSSRKADEDRMCLLTELLKNISADEHQENKPKTFLVQSYNNEGEQLFGKFEKYTMHSNNEYRLFLKSVGAKGLELISDVIDEPAVVTSFEYILPGERYKINASHLTVVRKGITWSQIEDKVMEDESLLAVKTFLHEMIKSHVEIFPERIMFKNKNPLMEWDGILVCNNKVFLIEEKHQMTDKHVEKILSRLNEFPNMLKATDSVKFKDLIGKQYIGIACGSLYPEKLRRMSIDKGLIVVFPSGNRYKVEAPHELMRAIKVSTCQLM